jgi:hypothetical protein
MPRLPIALAALIAASAALAHDPTARPQTVQAHDPLNCYCRAQGKTFAVGETACLRTGEGPRLAECGMVLNNTSWQFTGRTCPES